MSKTTDNYTKLGLAISAAEFKGMVLTKLSYIEASICQNQASIRRLKRANQKRKDWQETMNTKIKFSVGIAVFIGAIIVYVVDKAFDLFVNK